MKTLGRFKKHIRVGQLSNIIVLNSSAKAISTVFILSIFLGLPLSVFSQDQDREYQDIENSVEVDNSELVESESTDESSENSTDNDLKNRGLGKNENNAAYRVLGRNLSVKEDYAVNYTIEEMKQQFLPKELALTYVRAAIAVGEATYAAELIGKIPLDPIPFEDLVKQFTGWKKRHGNLENAVNAIYLQKLDDERVFQESVKVGYKEVFGRELVGEQEQKIYGYLKTKQATNYEDIKDTLMGLMTPDVKEKILLEVLSEVGRKDLLKNENFTKKILKQEFTYIELKKLVQGLKKSGKK